MHELLILGLGRAFSAILTRVALKKKAPVYRWIGVVIVVVGTCAVALSDVICGSSMATKESPANPPIGNALVILSQLVMGIQAVLEEKLFDKYSMPATPFSGFEGIYGFLGFLIISAILSQVPSKLTSPLGPTAP